MSEKLNESAGILQRVWPDWVICGTLGHGAFASVYRAERRDKIPGEKASAIKVIRIPHDDTDWDRLLNEGKTPDQVREFFMEAVEDALKEIRAMEELSGHTNIVNIFDYKRYHVPGENVWYILIRMELLDKVDAAGLDEKEIIRLGKDVCTALTLCRKKNIVHRDVSLDNVFIREGSYKLGDFGVAKVLEGTVSGQSMAGKPLYMAPEIYNAVLADNADTDSLARVDIYSLGILLYRLCHKMNYPFEDPDKANVPASERGAAFRRRVIDGEALPPPREASEGLARVILKACAADPDKRFASADEMREALEALEKPAAPDPARRKKLLTAAAAAAAAVLIFIGGFLLVRAWKDHRDKQRDYHVVLTVPDSMNIKEYNAALKVLRERLDIFTRGLRGYGWVVNEDRIDLTLPVEAFAGRDMKTVLACYLTRPMNLVAANMADPTFQAFPSKVKGIVPIERQDMEAVTVGEGAVEGLDPAEFGIDGDGCVYVKMVMTDSFAAAHGADVDAWDKLAFVQNTDSDYDGGVYYYVSAFSAGDGKTYYIPSDQRRLAELVCQSLTGDPMPDALIIEADMNSLTVWQKKSDTALWGENQCEAGDLTEETVTFLITCTRKLTEGEKLDAEIVLKARLDGIGVPYAMGITDTYPEKELSSDNMFYTIKMPANRMGTALMGMLTGSDVTIAEGLNRAEVSFAGNTYVTVPDGDGADFILTPDNMFYAPRVTAIAGDAAEKDEYLYICWEGNNNYNIPLFAAKAEDVHEDGSIVIRYLCALQDGRYVVRPLKPEDRWRAEFFRALLNDRLFLPLMYLRKYQVNTPGGQWPQQDRFGLDLSMGTEAIEKRAQEIWPSASVSGNSGYSSFTAYITLPFENWDTLSQNAPRVVQEIYEALDFPSLMGVDCLHFDLKVSQERNNQASISFTKKYKTSDTGKDGYIYTGGTFGRAVSEEDRDKMIECIGDMPFYTELTHEETKWSSLTY